MECEYSVVLNDRTVGTATVKQQGLYYQVSAVCQIPAEGIHRLKIECGNKITDLGILVKCNGAFALNTKIPIKRVGTGNLRLWVYDDNEAEKFYPIYEDRPFAHMDQLGNAKFYRHSDQAGIIIKTAKDPQGNDRNP